MSMRFFVFGLGLRITEASLRVETIGIVLLDNKKPKIVLLNSVGPGLYAEDAVV